MKSLSSGFIMGAGLGTLGFYWRKRQQNAANSSNWANQLKSITTQLKQDVIPTVKEIKQTVSEEQAQISEDLQQIMETTNNLKEKLPQK
ncbi:hypothetical protein [Bombilactobacillus bombi]|uniref:hypothetical protein n=1 Tax=Bombilactobacillus bombi TaxID=1303590 RepID=UPI0015E5B463|nr:hypothetical protein [Bombilactobacillus bombi]MBA1434582.1 hypothetical protein [Bombilactobacillus bombi]